MATPIPAVPEVHEILDSLKEPLTEPLLEPEPQLQVEPEPPTTVEEQEPAPLLSDLASVERLLITRRLRVKGVLFLRGKKNRFFVRTPDQRLVYTVEEENRQFPSSWWVGYFCYGLRPLQLRVCNSLGQEVIRIVRPYAFTTRLLPCQLQRLQVFSPPGQLIGSVQQQWTALKPLYLVRDNDGNDVFWIRGPCVTLSCFNDVMFHIQRPDGKAVGATCKRWEGVMHALFLAPVTDKFGVAFDQDLTMEEKALLLAATLLLDYMYYDV